MIANIIKLIWNQRRKNALIVIEMFALFILLFYSSYTLLGMLSSYLYPENYTLHNRVYLKLSCNNGKYTEKQRLQVALASSLELIDGVEAVGIAFDAPLTGSSSNSQVTLGSAQAYATTRCGNQKLKDVLELRLIDGRWFTDQEVNLYTSAAPFFRVNNEGVEEEIVPEEVFDALSAPIVIDKLLWEKLSPNEPIVGKKVVAYKRACVVVGVIEPIKRSPLEDPDPCVYFPTQWPLSYGNSRLEFYLKVKDTQDTKLYQAISSTAFSVVDGSEWNIMDLGPAESIRASWIESEKPQFMILLFLTAFVLFTAMLGLVGILTYNINKRRSEIGILRAIGSSQRALQWRLVLEMVTVSLMGIVPALLLLVQIPLLKITYTNPPFFYKTLLIVLVFTVSLVVAFVWYPAWKASRIEPAMALKDE